MYQFHIFELYFHLLTFHVETLGLYCFKRDFRWLAVGVWRG